MPLTGDILRTWRAPRRVIRRQMQEGPREDRLVFLVMLGCFLMFVAQTPLQARLAEQSGRAGGETLGLDMLLGTAFFGWLMIMPLLLYLAAGLSAVVMTLLHLRVSGHDARLALFWAVLAATPAALLAGLVNGLAGPGPGADVAGLIWLGALLLFWGLGLREALAAGRERAAQ
jgi:uncharacterized oligopeptide transporter (OPT) family protein